MTYDNLSHFFADTGMLHKDRDNWRLTKPCIGHINGLEKTFRGKLVATNGILCYLKTSGGQLLCGHLDWFVKDPTEHSPTFTDGSTVNITKNKKSETLASDLLKLITQIDA